MSQSMEQPSLSIIIVHYKNNEILLKCIDSLPVKSPDIELEVLIIRNDGVTNNGVLEQALSKKTSDYSIIVNTENAGFGKACNQGANLARGTHLFFLNPDTKLESNTIQSLMEFCDSKQDCGIVAPLIRNEDASVQRSARTFPGLRTAFFGRTSLMTRLFPNNPFTKAEFTSREEMEENESYAVVDWVSGAAMLCKKTVFQSVSGFDEQFFMYWEDADICFRLKEKGFRVYYLKTTELLHAAGSCSNENRQQTIVEFHNSVYKYYCKNINKSSTLFSTLSRTMVWFGLKMRLALKLFISAISG